MTFTHWDREVYSSHFCGDKANLLGTTLGTLPNSRFAHELLTKVLKSEIELSRPQSPTRYENAMTTFFDDAKPDPKYSGPPGGATFVGWSPNLLK